MYEYKVKDYIGYEPILAPHILLSVIFQEVLHILYFKIIPAISQKFNSNL